MASYETNRSQSHQVFLSFRGAEIRQSFVAHLVSAFRREGVNVYVDQGMMMRGGTDLKILSQRIEESTIALVIFSERYTESEWCLDELVKIKEQVEVGKLMAIPIFYKVSPSHVKRLDGKFGLNLWELGKDSEFDNLKKWKEALYFFSTTLGFRVNENSDEVAVIKSVTEEVIRSMIRLVKKAKDEFPGKVIKDNDNLNVENDATTMLPSSEEVYSNNEENEKGSVSGSFAMVTDRNPTSKHKVFINYRGSDVCFSFLGYLGMALKSSGVSVVVDDDFCGAPLEIIFKKIEESKIAIVIFSRKYAESTWCLNELVKIKELADKEKLVVIPIFYKVKVSHVARLEGEFGFKFWNLWRINRDDHIIEWKKALKSITNRKGFAVMEMSDVDVIVKEVLKIIASLNEEETSLCPSIEKRKGQELESDVNKDELFGMEQRMVQLEKKLEFDCDETRIIGVVGLPGIGKTTLAMMLHKKWNRRFIRSVPLLDIHKKSDNDGPVWLRQTLLELLLEGNSPEINEKTTHGSVKAELLKNKFFAVLDDVSDKRQLEFLLGELDWIKEGSKIIITTCDKSLLEGFSHDIYVVPGLNDTEASQLFRHHALDDQTYSMFGDYARGHPLTLKLIAKELNETPEGQWESKLEMLTKESNMMFQDVWRLSTDQLKLSEMQKDVFLDIVCLFMSEDEYFVRSLLDSGDPDSIDGPSEVKDLVNKFLITIDGGRVETNVPLYTFSKDLGSPRWLRFWNHEDIINKLMTMEKSDANKVRGIFLDMSKLTKSICLDISAFVNMCNLRYMKIYDSCCLRQCELDSKLKFPDGLEFPLVEVRYLHWVKFPLEELPSDFIPENLVDLSLPYSKITRVWEGVKDTPRLKWVDLSHSSELLDLSGLSMAVNLQRLNMEGCTSLDELPVEIQNMKSLVYLNLRGCIRLWCLPNINLISLKTLILSDCSDLNEFQMISESIEFLHLDGTAIKELPPSIENLQRLVVLNLKNCEMLESVPNCLGNLETLEKLILSGCSRLKNIPDFRNSIKHLQILLLDATAAKEMPSISLSTEPQGPYSVREWPRDVNRVSSLRRLCLSGNDFISLQPDIGKLSNLKWLDVKQCKKLISIPMLPPRLQYFDAHGCDSLERVANPLTVSPLSDQTHATFNFSNCNSLDQDAKVSIISYTRERSQSVLDELSRYSGGLVLEALIGTCFPGWQVPAWFSHRASGSTLKAKLPPHWFDNKFIGIGLCAVITFGGYHNQRKRVLIKCKCEFKNEDGSRIRVSCTVGGWSEPSNTPRNIRSSHVFIGFTSRLDNINIISEEYDEEECGITETMIRFQVTDGMEEIQGCEVVKCGFSLVYAPEERANVQI